MVKERITWIDVARGIGILLVMYGHGLTGDSYRFIIYAFHMPFFFFLSGIVFHHKKYETLFHSITRDIKKILIPYFIFACIGLLIWTMITPRPTAHILYQLQSIFYGNGNYNYLVFNNILWFLPCLFVTKTIFGVINYFTNNDKKIIFCLIWFSLLGYILSLMYPLLKLPFGIETALSAVVFFGIGYLFNKHLVKESHIFSNYSLPLLGISTALCIFFAVSSYQLFDNQIDMRQNRLFDYALFYGGALAGIISMVTLSFIIHKNTVLEYIGKNSMPLFVWHLVLFSFFTKFVLLFTNSSIISEYRNSIFSILYSFFAIIIILGCVFLTQYIKKFSILRNRS